MITFKNKLIYSLCAGAILLTSAAIAKTENKTFATVVKLVGVGWFDRMEEGINEFAENNENITTFQQGPVQADAAQQAQLVEDLIAQKVTGLAVVPLSPNTLEVIFKKARDNGIIVVTHEGSTIKNIDYDIEAFDNEAYGIHLMDALAERMGEKGEYVTFVGNLSNVTHNIWIDAAVAYQKEKYPHMKRVGDKYISNEDAQTAYRKTQEILVASPNVKGFLGSSALDVVGIGQAIDEAGLNEVTFVVGTSIVSMAGTGLEVGSVDMISFWDPKIAGLAMNEILKRVSEGQKINTGDNLGLQGYESVIVNDKVIYGSAWIDVTVDNMNDYDF